MEGKDMNKRMVILVLVVLVVELLTGCGVSVSQTEFQNLAERIEALEMKKEAQAEPETTISVAEFQELMARVQTLEEMNQVKETEVQEAEAEELTSIVCNTWQAGFIKIELFDKMEDAVQNSVEIEVTTLQEEYKGILADFYIPEEVDAVIKRYSTPSSGGKVLQGEITNRKISENIFVQLDEDASFRIFHDEYSTLMKDSIFYEVQYNGKTQYFAVELK